MKIIIHFYNGKDYEIADVIKREVNMKNYIVTTKNKNYNFNTTEIESVSVIEKETLS